MKHTKTNSETLLPLDAIKKIAKLCKLNCSNEELMKFQQELNSVLAHLKQLNELDVKDSEPLCHPLDLMDGIDEDYVTTPLDKKIILDNAPKSNNDFFCIPSVRSSTK